MWDIPARARADRVVSKQLPDTEPQYSFRLVLPKLSFSGIDIDKDLGTKTAKTLLPEVLTGSARYQLSRGRFVRK